MNQTQGGTSSICMPDQQLGRGLLLGIKFVTLYPLVWSRIVQQLDCHCIKMPHRVLWDSEMLCVASLRQARGLIDDGSATCQQVDGTLDKRWEGTFPWSSQAQALLRDFFGSRDFRLNQRQALNATMSGLDCFVLMPTGGGVWSQVLFLQLHSYTDSIAVVVPSCHLIDLTSVSRPTE